MNELGEEIAHQIIKGDVITVVLLSHYFSHFEYLEYLLTVVQIEEEAGDPGYSNETNRIKSGLSRILIYEILCFGGEIEASWAIADEWAEITDCSFAPEGETFT